MPMAHKLKFKRDIRDFQNKQKQFKNFMVLNMESNADSRQEKNSNRYVHSQMRLQSLFGSTHKLRNHEELDGRNTAKDKLKTMPKVRENDVSPSSVYDNKGIQSYKQSRRGKRRRIYRNTSKLTLPSEAGKQTRSKDAHSASSSSLVPAIKLVLKKQSGKMMHDQSMKALPYNSQEYGPGLTHDSAAMQR